MSLRCWRRFAASVAAALVLFSASAFASERHFTYAYESPVLNPGDIEIEPWTTLRAGRDNYYQRYDLRLEFEYGLVDSLQTALYWNFTSVAQDVEVPQAEDQREVTFQFAGVSSEWKYKLTDSVADPIGSALYLEGTAAPTEAELEAKVIVDKRAGNLLAAFNAVAEYEWEFEADGETERELIFAPVAALGYFVTPRFSVGVELQNQTVVEHGELEYSAFFAGPVVAYGAHPWWMALTVLPQFAAIKEEGSGLELEHREQLEVRLLLGFHVAGPGDQLGGATGAYAVQ